MVKYVRPIIALIATVGITAGFFTDKINAQAYLALMSVAITWWFKSRDDDKKVV